MFQIIYQGAALILLLVYTVSDVKEKKVWYPLALIMGAAGIALHVYAGDRVLLANVYALIPGFMLAVLARITGQAIGYGDCLTIGACGALTSLRHVCVLTMAAMILASFWAIFLLIGKKADKETRFPFMPFLLTAQMILFLL